MSNNGLETELKTSRVVADLSLRERVRGAILTVLEIVAIFGVFVAYGAWPVPDVNEQYYVGKAIHFWNPEWLGHDPFLNTPDSHWLFYAVFGLLSLAFKQNALVWVGRCVVWFATACAWRRLSWSLIPRRWIGVLTAACFAFYLESFHLAGEWIIGGIEGKGLAFPFVFWGLACFFEGKYGRAWVLFGIGSAFHVLVGGWVVLASFGALAIQTFIAWLNARRSSRAEVAESSRSFCRALFRSQSFRRGTAGLFLGGACSLIGLIPALKLDFGASASEVAEAHRIYVYERLSHHLVVSSLPWTFLLRFVGLLVVFFVARQILKSFTKRNDELLTALREATDAERRDAFCDERLGFRVCRARYFRLTAFVFVAVLFATFGAVVDFGSLYLESAGKLGSHEAAAGILRYYWYRLSDWAVPLGVVFTFCAIGAEFAHYFRFFHINRDIVDSKERFFGASALSWLAIILGVYWALRFTLCRVASSIAASQASDGLIPLPKPTESPSFICCVALVGIALAFFLFFVSILTRCKGRSTINRIPLWLTNGVALWLLLTAVLAPCWRLGTFVDLRGTKVIPRSAPPKDSIAKGWLDACHWCRDNTTNEKVFLVPRGCDSFKWEAQRAEAGSWKEIPQDASSIIAWNKKMKAFYANPGAEPGSDTYWNQPLVGVFINKGRKRVLEESKRYGFQYAIVEAPPYVVATIPEALARWKEFEKNDLVYQNEQFLVLRFDDEDK